ncbi:hypothetical protein BU24DRAFT_18465 [Aaosphaeria arxii CBS 175.79]|uniref:Zn(2)-C6 fungal-type domain-containing protein n=1 Tax=Aaosphaeria arxii CBS 175.79 TaxID=1450172 RepID=A0A6A5Y961_9PLEO|nr:uncharacterized protein BU24DRAFT_18465 [Aaosphaeria arxii CBS 175.79]KAF2021291.1 hypothetical protein BU24DRAFT_18465 [Aaosphaeria arxii CBS 175.79]
MANFRPLQPAPMDQEQPSHPQGRPILTQKPKRTVTLGACVACRKRKSKCDGIRPICTCCTQKDTECIYELGPNEKPSQAMKRKNEEMQGELSNLRQVYDFLRLRPEQEAMEIFRRIRSDPPDSLTPTQHIQDLADFVRHGDPSLQHSLPPSLAHRPESLTLPPLRMALDSSSNDPSILSSNFSIGSRLPSISSDGPSSQRRRHDSDVDVSAHLDSQGSRPRPISIQAMIHQPGFTESQAPADVRLHSARNWTNATDDTNLLVHLMSAWHRWEYRFYHFLDWEIFLDDMASGRTDFCSRLLVNAMMASASFQSSKVKDRSKPFSDSSSITRFYKEAKALWEAGEGQDSLTRLQAAMCLYLVLGKHGRDKVGYTMLAEACRIGRDLGLFRLTSSSPKSSSVSSARWEKARAVTAWALFNFQLTMSFTFTFPALIKSQPPLAIPYDDTPNSEALFRSECARHVILLDCGKYLGMADDNDNEIPPKPEQVEVFYNRWKLWYDNRPTSIEPHANPSPENLLTAMVYHITIIRLVQPFVSRDSPIERIRSYQDRARHLTSASIAEIRQLLTLQEIHHGWKHAIPYVLHPVMVTSFASLEEVILEEELRREPEGGVAYQGLLTCLRALSALSHTIFYAQVLFRVLAQTCLSLEMRLPPDMLDLLDLYQSDEWTKKAAASVSSQYVADLRKSALDIDNARMDSIISQWDESLALGTRSSRDSSRATSGNSDIVKPEEV